MIAEVESTGPPSKSPPAAIPAERVHCLLRRMPDGDWTRLKSLLLEHLGRTYGETDIDILERFFRKGDAVGPQAGGAVIRVTQEILGTPELIGFVREAKERLRQRIRFVLQEMSDPDWAAFKARLEAHLNPATKTEDIRLLELVFRIGESVSNIETAAAALADRVSGRRLLAPEIARRNAMIKAATPGCAHIDPETVYQQAKQAIENAAATLARAQNTLAYRQVEPTAAYRHARNTLFKAVDAILESEALMTDIIRIEGDLARVGPVTREQMRWALHRMPIPQRMMVLRLIPLNTVLVFQDGIAGGAPDALLKATRDRRLAFDLFVKGRDEEELAAAYGLKLNAVKNAVGAILQALLARPMVRQAILEYLERVGRIEPMDIDEARRRLRQLQPTQRAELLSTVPSCAWKVRSAMLLHKHLFLDYLSGEWVLGTLVDYYNLEKRQRLTGTFRFQEALTLRGAQAAISGMYQKIVDEPELRERLRQWTTAHAVAGDGGPEALIEEPEPAVAELMPALPRPDDEPADRRPTFPDNHCPAL